MSQATVRYTGILPHGRLALDSVSFHLRVGEQVAVVGPNGAGKSTLFKAIAGVLPLTSGEVKVFGHGPGGHICIAYVPQRSQVDWTFPVSVADVVMMGRIGKIGLFSWPRAADWSRVRQSLDVVGLTDLADRQISELSGGQQQRMFIARALAQEAELMLLDEPLTGLDLTAQDDILHILEALRRRNVTVMVATHDLNLAADGAGGYPGRGRAEHAAESAAFGRFDRVMLLNHRLLGLGRPEEVLTPEHLMEAYGGHLRVIQTGREDTRDEVLVLGDTCCGEGAPTNESLA